MECALRQLITTYHQNLYIFAVSLSVDLKTVKSNGRVFCGQVIVTYFSMEIVRSVRKAFCHRADRSDVVRSAAICYGTDGRFFPVR